MNVIMNRFADDRDVLLNDLAKELEVDSSSLRRFMRKHKFTPFQIRASRNQLSFALSKEDADELKELWLTGKLEAEAKIQNANKRDVGGCFYVIALMPELPGRIKVGFTNHLMRRLAVYQTLCPSAEAIAQWPCRRSWERAAIASIVNMGCKQIANEIFDCEDKTPVLNAIQRFFELMPKVP